MALRPIIFLDFDGVLHSHDVKAEVAADAEWEENVKGLFNKGDRLKKIVDATKARIVCSSSWRKDTEQYDSGKKLLRDYFKLEIEGETPNLGADREAEIYQWFEDEGMHCTVVKWGAIDDFIDFFPNLSSEFPERFVYCANANVGLTEGLVQEAIKKLNGTWS
jgi:hypothetical protein